MSPLNNDELNSLLEQAKRMPPEPNSELVVRAFRAYQRSITPASTGWRLLVRPVPIPVPLGILAAVFLVLIGAICDRSLRRPLTIIGERHSVQTPATGEHVVYLDCPGGPDALSQSAAILSFKQFEPVREIRPRVVKE